MATTLRRCYNGSSSVRVRASVAPPRATRAAAAAPTTTTLMTTADDVDGVSSLSFLFARPRLVTLRLYMYCFLSTPKDQKPSCEQKNGKRKPFLRERNNSRRNCLFALERLASINNKERKKKLNPDQKRPLSSLSHSLRPPTIQPQPPLADDDAAASS